MVVFLAVVAVGLVLTSKQPSQGILEGLERIPIAGNALLPITNPYYPKPLVYGVLIDCLIKHESGGRADAVGDKGKARNVLQFWESTFNQYKSKYNMGYLSWDNAQDQMLLADLMLEKNFQNINHWSVKDKCL